MVKNLPANTEDTRDAVGSLSQEDSLEKEMATHSSIPVFLPRKFHRQRRLAGYSPWGCKESDTTERLNTHTHTNSHHSKKMLMHSINNLSLTAILDCKMHLKF